LQALSAQLLERGIRGGELSQLEDGWLPLLEPFPWGRDQAQALSLRGSTLFRIGARLLRSDESAAAAAGAVWSLVDGARHCSDSASRALLMDEARSALAGVPARMPRRLRGLTVVAALAATGLFREGDGARRLKAAMAHRLLGTFPRN
jgi:phytoene synthase